MTTYRITSKAGQDYGTYEGDTPEEAWLAMIQDGGRERPDETTGDIEDWIVEPVGVDPIEAERLVS